MNNMRRLLCAGAVLMLACLAEQSASAQGELIKNSVNTPVQVETIAVLPWYLSKGTEGAQKTAKEFLPTLLTKIKVEQVSEVKAMAAWDEVNESEFTSEKFPFASAPQLLRVGQKLGVDWVMSGNVTWHSRSIWVGLGPKTKSTCTINVRIVDVKRQEVALDVKDLKMDSTAKEDTLKALGTVFVTGLFTFVSGGPKTPHEQRAVQLGITKALEPWLAQHLKAMKIDPKTK